MKRVKVLVASVLFCMMGYVGFATYESVAITEATEFMKANVEALTSNESGGDGWVHCRCHSDQKCYLGNKISFRPACVRLSTPDDCGRFSENCPPAGVI